MDVSKLDHVINILESKKAFLEFMLDYREEEISALKEKIEIEDNVVTLLES